MIYFPLADMCLPAIRVTSIRLQSESPNEPNSVTTMALANPGELERVLRSCA
jgi:hypothetical protein